jgi:uncharacterized protein YggU (UPF0235/DUF167 family)
MAARWLEVRVTPRSQTESVSINPAGVVSVRVKASPTDGAANQAVLRVLGRALNVPPTSLSIHSGYSARRKRIEMDGLSVAEALAQLNRGLPASAPPTPDA